MMAAFVFKPLWLWKELAAGLLNRKERTRLVRDLRQACGSTPSWLFAMDNGTWNPSESTKGTRQWKQLSGIVQCSRQSRLDL